MRKLLQVLSKYIHQLQHFHEQHAPAKVIARKINHDIAKTTILQKLFIGAVKRNEIDLASAGFAQHANGTVDGILLYLFAKAGFTNRQLVDIGSGDGLNGNSANLIIHHSFKALLVDGEPSEHAFGREFYKYLQITNKPAFHTGFVYTSNINQIIAQGKVAQQPDLLSLDIDSMDLYILDALEIQPRVIVVEFNSMWGPDESYSVPHSDHFKRELNKFLYGGASLLAFQRVLKRKGYKLIAVDGTGYDAFFVLDNAEFAEIPEQKIEDLYCKSYNWQESHQSSLHSHFRKKDWVVIE